MNMKQGRYTLWTSLAGSALLGLSLTLGSSSALALTADELSAAMMNAAPLEGKSTGEGNSTAPNSTPATPTTPAVPAASAAGNASPNPTALQQALGSDWRRIRVPMTAINADKVPLSFFSERYRLGSPAIIQLDTEIEAGAAFGGYALHSPEAEAFYHQLVLVARHQTPWPLMRIDTEEYSPLLSPGNPYRCNAVKTLGIDSSEDRPRYHVTMMLMCSKPGSNRPVGAEFSFEQVVQGDALSVTNQTLTEERLAEQAYEDFSFWGGRLVKGLERGGYLPY